MANTKIPSYTEINNAIKKIADIPSRVDDEGYIIADGVSLTKNVYDPKNGDYELHVRDKKNNKWQSFDTEEGADCVERAAKCFVDFYDAKHKSESHKFNCSMQKKKESLSKKSEATEVKDPQYYLDMFDKAYKECVQLDIDDGGDGQNWANYFATGDGDPTTFSQKEADEIVGYYMEFHPNWEGETDRPYKDWMENIDNTPKTALDKEITRILKALYAPNKSKKSEGINDVRAFIEQTGCLDAIADCLAKMCMSAKETAISNGLHTLQGNIYTAHLNDVLETALISDYSSVEEHITDCISDFVKQEVPPKSN